MTVIGNSSTEQEKLRSELLSAFKNPVTVETYGNSFLSFLVRFLRLPLRTKRFHFALNNPDFVEFEQINPLYLSAEDCVKLLPLAFIRAFDLCDHESRAMFLHPYLWPLGEKEFLKPLSALRSGQKRAIWHSIVYTYEIIIDAKDDPFWLTRKEYFRNILVQGEDVTVY